MTRVLCLRGAKCHRKVQCRVCVTYLQVFASNVALLWRIFAAIKKFVTVHEVLRLKA